MCVRARPATLLLIPPEGGILSPHRGSADEVKISLMFAPKMSIKMRNRSDFFPHCHLFSCVLRASYHWWTFFCRCFDFDSRELASEWLPEPNTQELSLSRFAQKLNSNKRYLVRRRKIYEKLHVAGAHGSHIYSVLDGAWLSLNSLHGWLDSTLADSCASNIKKREEKRRNYKSVNSDKWKHQKLYFPL